MSEIRAWVRNTASPAKRTCRRAFVVLTILATIAFGVFSVIITVDLMVDSPVARTMGLSWVCLMVLYFFCLWLFTDE